MSYDSWKTRSDRDDVSAQNHPCPSNKNDTFDVWQWIKGDVHECVGRGLGANEAVELAYSCYAERPAAKLGIIERVTIVDSDDFTCFEWTFGKGVTFK